MRASNNNYNKSLKPLARAHRKSSTKAEVRLWCELLKSKQMMGYAFLRQRPIDQFIADFFCKKLKLIIETDGVTHGWEGAEKKDQERTRKLELLGYHVLRFDDREVMRNLSRVRVEIEEWIKEQVEKQGK